MSFITQPSWVFSPNSINGVSSSKPNLPSSSSSNLKPRPRKISASLNGSNSESSDSSGKSSEDELAAIKDPVKLAFAKAKLYKKSKQSEPVVPKQNEAQILDSREIGTRKDVLGSDDGSGESTKEIPLSVKVAMEKAKEYKKEKGTAGSDAIVEVKKKDSGSEKKSVGNSGYGVREETFRKKEMSAVSSSIFIGLAFGGKKKGKGLPAGLMPMVDSFPDGNFPEVEIIIGDKSKFERARPVKSESDSTVEAKEYKKEKETAGSNDIVEVEKHDSGLKKANVENSGYGVREETFRKKEMSAVSSTDFIGLDFGGKKKGRGLPPGLMPMVDSFPDGDFPEVEIIVGDKSKFERPRPVKSEPNSTVEDDSEVYKPKVSTWGVFPRPSNISKTYGGGRVIRPEDILEESKEKSAKDARTRKLIAAYKSKTGANIDPKLKTECEKALKEGDYLMDVGKLKDALPYYEKVMQDLVFQNELHGQAALQWSICQDSLTRQGEARAMYEKLQSHPNFEVRKKASQLLFSFQAMEMMKVTSSSPATTTGYDNYFDAFLEEKGSISLRVGEEEKEGALRQALPYIIFLISPILFVLVMAVRKGA